MTTTTTSVSQVPQITWDYIILLIYIVFNVVFMWVRWPWIDKALSEGKDPSSKRLMGFWAIQMAMMCEVFYVIKKGDLPLSHLVSWLIFAAICLGLATTAQIIEAYKGRGPYTQQTTTEASASITTTSTVNNP